MAQENPFFACPEDIGRTLDRYLDRIDFYNKRIKSYQDRINDYQKRIGNLLQDSCDKVGE